MALTNVKTPHFRRHVNDHLGSAPFLLQFYMLSNDLDLDHSIGYRQ